MLVQNINDIVFDRSLAKKYSHGLYVYPENEAKKVASEYGPSTIGVCPTMKGFAPIRIMKSEEKYIIRALYEYAVIEKSYDLALENVLAKIQEIGKIVFCQYRGEGDRMYIVSSPWQAIETKYGWRDTFSLLPEKGPDIPVISGKRYLCHLRGFRVDTRGYLIAVVDPFYQLGDNLEIDEWIYHHQDRFVGEEGTSMDMGFSSFITTIKDLNIWKAMTIPFEDFENEPSNPEIIKKILEYLHTPTKKALNREALLEAAKTNPEIEKRIQQHGVSSYISMIEESFHNLVMKKEVEYTDDIVEKANAILQYYKLKKEREKAERKERKKKNRKKEGLENS